MADAMWPALVAAVHARPAEWTAEQLLEAATSGRGPDVRPEDLCSALVWRIATMTDAPFEEPEPFEPDFAPVDPTAPAQVPEPIGSDTPAARIVELNEWALNHYTSMYSRSWAPDYLRERLGTDLANDERYRVGYAPPGPTSLIQRLTARGASLEELIDAGLARQTERGRVLDSFRDRLVFPIYSGSDLVGFIGRRNPTKGDHEFAGPKYLNTRGTAVFVKGEQLFGLTEAAADLAAGASLVLVEGPMDAIAVTLASDGTYVGIAPLGTAFTEAQAAKLKPYLHDDPERVVIATDPDAAGWQAARGAFWRLVALRANPRFLSLPETLDPADILRTEGPVALADRLSRSSGFADSLIERLLDERLAVDCDPFSRVELGRELARIIGALPPDQWLQHTEHVANQLDLPLSLLQQEVVEAGSQWTDTPQECSARELATRRPPAGECATTTRTCPVLHQAERPCPHLVPRANQPNRCSLGALAIGTPLDRRWRRWRQALDTATRPRWCAASG